MVVKVDPDCKQACDDLHYKHIHSYIIFRITDDNTTIVVEKTSGKHTSRENFNDAIKKICVNEHQCRYIVADAMELALDQYVPSVNKSVFVEFYPEQASTNQKNLYDSSAAALVEFLGAENLIQVRESNMLNLGVAIKDGLKKQEIF